MTATLHTPAWGVRVTHTTDPNHVDARANEADARRWLHALQYCGHTDARLVTRIPGGDWVPVEDGDGDGHA